MDYDNPSPKTAYGELHAAKLAAEREYLNQAKCETVGLAGQPYRPTLRDRLKRQIEHSQQEASRARRADELYDLLCKHPDVARILELIEEIGA